MDADAVPAEGKIAAAPSKTEKKAKKTACSLLIVGYKTRPIPYRYGPN
jgi:hypothetical protein